MMQGTSPTGGKRVHGGGAAAMVAVAIVAATPAGAARTGGLDQVVSFDFEPNNIHFIDVAPFDLDGKVLTGAHFELTGAVDLSANLLGAADEVTTVGSLLVHHGLWLDWTGTTIPMAIAIDSESALSCDGPPPSGGSCDLGGPARFEGSVEGAIPADQFHRFRAVDGVESIEVALVGLATLASDHDVDIEAHRVSGQFTLTYVFEEAPSCGADLDGSGDVGFVDLMTVVAQWGSCAGCGADITGDGRVGFNDLAAVLEAWGECP